MAPGWPLAPELDHTALFPAARPWIAPRRTTPGITNAARCRMLRKTQGLAPTGIVPFVVKLRE